ncbi:hypothetical protein C0992_011037 [Termitomyces sp. T32_za158]|nr:hypothetical protein C0992_011037 [Termitomyces sp. T32_za158]
MPYPGHEAPLPYEMPLHVQMEVDQEEERYKCQVRDVHHEHYYQLGPSRSQAPAKTYVCAVALPAEREYALQAQPELGTEALLQRLEAAGQPVPPTTSFLQDNLAVMVMEGLLDQIELMWRHHIATLEQNEHAAKRKLPSQEGVSGEPRQLKPLPLWADILAWAEFAQLLFLKEVIFPALLVQLTVVKLTTYPRTPVQYDGLAATAAADKEKQRVVPAIEDDSDYGQSQSKEEEAEEEESATQRFQHMQCNKKLAKKKANKAKAAAALAYRVQNDLSGHILDGLGVKVWGLLEVEQLNSCFCGALGPCHYYSYLTNTVFIRADANRAVAFEFNSGQVAKVPGIKVYQFTHWGFSGTLYELEWLYKYYANPHVPRRNCIVAYMLLSELKDFTQRCNMSLHDHTMMLLCSDPNYWDLVNLMQGPEDLSFMEKCHIPSCFLHIKDDGSTALHVTCTSDPNAPFNLEQLARYALIFGRPGMENTWQGIAVNFAYRMHW